MAVGRARL